MQIAIVPFINLMAPPVVTATLTIQAAAMMATVIPPSIRQHRFSYELIHVVAILSTLTTFGMVNNGLALPYSILDMEMTGSVSPLLSTMGRSKRFSSINTADSTHVFVAHLSVKGNDQLCTSGKLLMDPTMLDVMADAHFTSLSDTVALEVSTIVREVVGTGMTSGTLDQYSVMFNLSHCSQGKLSMEFSVLPVMCAVNLNAKDHLYAF